MVRFLVIAFAAIILVLTLQSYDALCAEEASQRLKSLLQSEIQDSDKVKTSVRHHHIYASDSLSGKGMNLATSFDTTIYEAGLFRNLTTSNGTLITRSSQFPMTSSSAFTSNTWINFDAQCSENLSTGAKLRLYTESDSDYDASKPGSPYGRTARVFGVMMPTGNFNALVPGRPGFADAPPLPSFNTSLDKAYVSGKGPRSCWMLEGGNLYPSMGSQYNKYLGMEHFLFRLPVSQMSIFGHMKRQDKLYSESIPLNRMPGYGVKGSGEIGRINYECFALRNEETPLTINRDYEYGGLRAGYSSEKLRLAGSFMSSAQLKARSFEEPDLPSRRSEDISALEGEYDISPAIGLYGSVAASHYREDGIRSSLVFPGHASIFGIHAFFLEKKLQADLRWQYLDPNFEPISHHKRSVYPTNYTGTRYEVKYYFGSGEEMKKERNMVACHVCSFSQVDANVNIEPGRGFDSFALPDYIFPSGTTAAMPNTVKGNISIFSPEFDLRFKDFPFHFGGYYEDLRLLRGMDASGRSYDKRVTNLSAWADLELGRRIELVAGLRKVNFDGSWFVTDNPYAFSQTGTIRKIGIAYDTHQNLKVNAMYHMYDFADSSPSRAADKSTSDNNWSGGLFFLETSITF